MHITRRFINFDIQTLAKPLLFELSLQRFKPQESQCCFTDAIGKHFTRPEKTFLQNLSFCLNSIKEKQILKRSLIKWSNLGYISSNKTTPDHHMITSDLLCDTTGNIFLKIHRFV